MTGPKTLAKANQPAKRASHPAARIRADGRGGHFMPQAYQTLRGWAVGTHLETHAIIECSEHGHIRDRGTWAYGWDEAREIARKHPFAKATRRESLLAIDDVMSSIGDECPECT